MTILQPGSYEVRVRTSDSGTYVEFAKIIWNTSAGRGGGIGYGYQVVAKAPCKVESGDAKAVRTSAEIIPGSAARLSSLELRRDSKEYVFSADPR
jgi:hypothetical protein